MAMVVVVEVVGSGQGGDRSSRAVDQSVGLGRMRQIDSVAGWRWTGASSTVGRERCGAVDFGGDARRAWTCDAVPSKRRVRW
jgi:hypothetical protein